MARQSGTRDFALDRTAVVLISTRNPLNIGAAARAMSNFGFRDLRTVNPYELAFREAKSAVGAKDVLAKARVCTSVADAVADCALVVGTTAGRSRQREHELKSLAEGARLIRSGLRSGRVAVLFGSEKRGLSNGDLSYCHWLLRIPTVERAPAMNLGQAVALCLYELVREKGPGSRTEPSSSKPSTVELERLGAVLLETLEVSGYLKANAGAPAEENIRRLIRRLALSADDSTTLLGMLRQMLWKMRN